MARIGYRRLSGAIGLSLQEQGTRGMWWEKRRALLDHLRSRRHEVRLVNRLTKATLADKRTCEETLWDAPEEGKYDVLVIEFGGTNAQFFGKDLAATYRLVAAHKGPVVYVCDDPDLWYPWKATPEEDWTRWTVLVNAAVDRAGARVYPVPGGVRVLDLPVASLLSAGAPLPARGEHLAYIGRPDGRGDAFRRLIAAGAPFRVYGRSEEWEEFGLRVAEAPPQPQRGAFYATQLGCLAVSDKKHKRMLWRTGRAYHAISAGCPVLAEASHTLLAANFAAYGDPARVADWVARWRDPVTRAADVQAQQGAIAREAVLVGETLDRCGL